MTPSDSTREGVAAPTSGDYRRRMAETYTVTRTTTIEAPPEAVWAHLVDLHQWEAWSPWEGMDPDQQRTYTGSASGVGQHYAWSGNRKVGQGSMEITEADAPRRLVIDLRFVKPFRSSNTTSLELRPEDRGTFVTWSMTGPMTLMTRMMSPLRSMDKMLGPDFEKGLTALKSVSEQKA
jgi:uncharacterized protein YndB with AHSA1/START domain